MVEVRATNSPRLNIPVQNSSNEKSVRLQQLQQSFDKNIQNLLKYNPINILHFSHNLNLFNTNHFSDSPIDPLPVSWLKQFAAKKSEREREDWNDCNPVGEAPGHFTHFIILPLYSNPRLQSKSAKTRQHS